MNELKQILETLKQPEYVHVLLNPLPVYATAMGLLALVIALIMRSKPAQVLALILVIVGCVSVWPVSEYGEKAEDRVEAMSNKDGQEWLKAHGERADIGQFVFYGTAVLALVTLVALWKFPKAGQWLTAITLVGALACLAVGAWISHAGGQIRHTEFRNGPPPTQSPAEH